jgi:hypothetical protein
MEQILIPGPLRARRHSTLPRNVLPGRHVCTTPRSCSCYRSTPARVGRVHDHGPNLAGCGRLHYPLVFYRQIACPFCIMIIHEEEPPRGIFLLHGHMRRVNRVWQTRKIIRGAVVQHTASTNMLKSRQLQQEFRITCVGRTADRSTV